MENQIVRANMCEKGNIFKFKNYANILECTKIGSGILTEGYIQSS